MTTKLFFIARSSYPARGTPYGVQCELAPTRTVIDMASIDRSKYFLCQLISQLIETHFSALYAIFLPFLANANKNFEEKLKYSIKKC